MISLVKNHTKILSIQDRNVLSLMRKKKPSRKSIQKGHKNTLAQILMLISFKKWREESGYLLLNWRASCGRDPF